MHVIMNILNYRRGIHKHLYNLKVNFNKGLVLESDFQTTQFKTVHNNISIIVCLTWIGWKKKNLSGLTAILKSPWLEKSVLWVQVLIRGEGRRILSL